MNNALDGEGPFSTERAGTVPAGQLVDLCFSGQDSKLQIKKMLNGRGGLSAHLGMNDMITIAAKAEAGEEPFKSVVDGMFYSVAREVGARYVALKGQVDAIIVTGGIAHSDYCMKVFMPWIEYLAPVIMMPGEDEMGSLAYNAYGAMRGERTLQVYNPE